MIGNDVVDLAHPATRPGAQHPRFDARVFTGAERAALAQSPGAQRLRWIFWAAKESAYKAARKLDSRAIWSPARFAVQIEPAGPRELTALCGVVRHGAVTFSLRVESNAEQVHALAFCARTSAPDALRRFGVAPCAKGAPAGDAVRAVARREIAAWLGAAPETVCIGRRGRIPTLHIAGLPRQAADLSLSHHGRFVAWACEIERAALRNTLPPRARAAANHTRHGATRRVECHAV